MKITYFSNGVSSVYMLFFYNLLPLQVLLGFANISEIQYSLWGVNTVSKLDHKQSMDSIS
jgi:hypothetical protein